MPKTIFIVIIVLLCSSCKNRSVSYMVKTEHSIVDYTITYSSIDELSEAQEQRLQNKLQQLTKQEIPNQKNTEEINTFFQSELGWMTQVQAIETFFCIWSD